jgi:hypothetical protein
MWGSSACAPGFRKKDAVGEGVSAFFRAEPALITIIPNHPSNRTNNFNTFRQFALSFPVAKGETTVERGMPSCLALEPPFLAP